MVTNVNAKSIKMSTTLPEASQNSLSPYARTANKLMSLAPVSEQLVAARVRIPV